MAIRKNFIELTLTPVNDLVLVEGVGELNSFLMLGGDPSFDLGNVKLSPGYYEFEIEIASTLTELVEPTLYVDSGNGFNEKDALRLAFFPHAGRAKARILLRDGAKSLRFDPSNSRGTLVVGGAGLSSVSSMSIVVQEARREFRELRESLDFPDAIEVLSNNWDTQKFIENWLYHCSARTPQIGFYFDGERYSLNRAGAVYTYIEPQKPKGIDLILERLSNRPLFSVVVPSYNTPLHLMERVYNSVKQQWYPRWELVVVDDASPDAEALMFLERVADPRVKIIRSSTNQGIAGATNTGVDRATGDYVVLLDHDDELTLDCLYELALCINATEADYIYSDEDKIDLDGNYSEPHFKPDWSPDTMMSTMYVCHVSCIRRDLILSVGGLRSQYDGCQDWDLILRVTEATSKIAHIPKVLYHWRTLPGSVSVGLAEKPYVLDATKRVREDALARRALRGVVECIPGHPGYFGARYDPKPGTVVSIVIPTRDNPDVLSRCIRSIQVLNEYKNIEIVIVDNGSCEPKTATYLKEVSAAPNVTVVRWDHPFNFSQLCNIGANSTCGEVLLFLNDDTELIEPSSLSRMAGYAQLSHVGAVGAKLLYPGAELVQHAGVLNLNDGPGHAFLKERFDVWGYFGRNTLDYNWLAVTGACLMVERSKFLKVGGFDETFPIAYNDVEFCFKLRNAGYYSVMCQRAVLLHHESVSRGSDNIDPAKLERLANEKRRLYSAHPHFYQRDPFHNVNLHPNGINFDYAI